MINGKKLILLALLGFILTIAVFPMISGSVGEYDPWVDYNEDGLIDIFDVVHIAGAFGGIGEPINKAALLLELQTARTHNETYSTTLEEISGYDAMFNWQDMPDMTVKVTLETDATLLIMFSAQALTTQDWLEMHVRATVDSTQANPSTGVILTKSNEWASHSYTFYSPNLATGTYTIKIEWRLNDEVGSGQVMGRTLVVTALPA